MGNPADLTDRTDVADVAELATLAGSLVALAPEVGLDAVGIASAEPFDDVRRILEDRRDEGLHGGMAFTYRNPARSTDPSRSLPGAKALVVAARGYRRAPAPGQAASAGPRGVVARYSWEDHYEPLRAGLEQLAARLRADGWRARVLVDDNALVDRAAAVRAGIGWYGKNANVLLPGLGSWFVLGSVVTDAPLPVDDAVAGASDDAAAGGPTSEPTGCGTCDRCLPACPTGALVAPGVLDARRCLAWLLEAPGSFPIEFREALGGRIYGCDDCQEACPSNRAADRRSAPPEASPEATPTVDLIAMLAMSDSELLAHFGRWYVPKRDARYLRRNALVALGNVGRADDERVRRAIATALDDDDPIVREHAVWAARRLNMELAAPV